mmetsp:Transcript_8316/g.23819  ORF Transcript_8316/g.23819 Transcript_8316/m.23819 type:complete len:180 (-) Transcript_8316:526-1065(-)
MACVEGGSSMADLRHENGFIIAAIMRDEKTDAWQLKSVLEGCRGKDFTESLDAIRACVDTLIPEYLTEFRELSLERSFDMHKGDHVQITPDSPFATNEVFVGLGWETRCDIDSSIVLLSQDCRVRDIVYFSSKKDRATDGQFISHGGDNTTGDGDGDDEVAPLGLGLRGVGLRGSVQGH